MRALFFLFLFFSLISSLQAEVTDSILPTLEAFQENPSRYRSRVSKEQYGWIQEAVALKEQKIRVMSYNMLFDIKDALLPAKHRWPHRLSRIVELLDYLQPDIILMQELYPNQLDELLEEIGETFAFVGKGEKRGGRWGQHNGILYRLESFAPVEERIWYISSTPDKESPCPFEGKPVTLTYLRLSHKETGKILGCMNAHLSFGSPDSRLYAARFIAARAAECDQQEPLIVGGDYNTFDNRPDQVGLPFFDGRLLEELLTQGSLRDARRESLLGHIGPISSWTNAAGGPILPFMGTGTPGIILDHLYVSGPITVLSHAIEPARVNGEFPSDHLPVVADMIVGELIVDWAVAAQEK